MFAAYVIALLCWVSLSHSTPLACENQVLPVDHLDRHHLEGSWTLIAGSLNEQRFHEEAKRRDSAVITFANSSDPSTMAFTRSFGFNGTCEYMHKNLTLEGTGFPIPEYNLTVTVLKTSCADCVLMQFDNASKETKRLHLFCKKREVDQKVMEEFKAQTECLKLSLTFEMDLTKEPCPEQVPSNTATKTEEA